MVALPDQVLGWLYNNLKTHYRDVDRCYSEIAQTLSQYPSLSPRTEVYTFDDGASTLLLVLRGTIPVAFRGTTYRYPIAIWMPYEYPRAAPMAFVAPTQDMVVRAGQHVGVNGRVYHPYLANWQSRWEESNLPILLEVLKDIFTKEPPVMARQRPISGPQPGLQTGTPPPVPPGPHNQRSQGPPPRSSSLAHQGPPPPPPKPSNTPNSAPSSGPSAAPPRTGTADYAVRAPPPLPTGPGHNRAGSQHVPHQPQHLPYGRDGTSQSHSPTPSTPRSGPPPPPLPHEARRESSSNFAMMPSASGQQFDLPYRGQPPPQQDQPTMSYQHQSGPQQTYAGPPHQASAFPHQSHGVPQQQKQRHSHPPGQARSQQPQMKKPIEDLLSGMLDTPLPSQTNSSNTSIPAPPIPPNPEKDALLHAISQALSTQLTHLIHQNTSALPALQAQHTALLSAQSSMQHELSQLQSLSALLITNEQALHSALASADAQIESLKTRELPNVDEVLVGPTVVAEQLYKLVAEEKGIAEAMFVLGRALDRGRVAGEVFVKVMRQLARERFLKKVLIGKVARGMGLDVEGARV